jgi:ATP-dependent DNA helicase PIF1
MNETRLQEISGKGKLYKAKDTGKSPFLEQLQGNCPVAGTFAQKPSADHSKEQLKLKIGAQVMLMKNIGIRKGLVNGSRGVVIGFDDTRRGFPRILFSNGAELTIEPGKYCPPTVLTVVKKNGRLKFWVRRLHPESKCLSNWRGHCPSINAKARQSRKQVLSLALSLTQPEISLEKVFEYGQAYVALSRLSSVQGLRVLDFNPKAIRAHPKVIEFYRQFGSLGTMPERIQGISIDSESSHAKPFLNIGIMQNKTRFHSKLNMLAVHGPLVNIVQKR